MFNMEFNAGNIANAIIEEEILCCAFNSANLIIFLLLIFSLIALLFYLTRD